MIGQLMGWLVDWCVGCVDWVGWLCGLVGWSVGGLIDWLADWVRGRRTVGRGRTRVDWALGGGWMFGSGSCHLFRDRQNVNTIIIPRTLKHYSSNSRVRSCHERTVNNSKVPDHTMFTQPSCPNNNFAMIAWARGYAVLLTQP